MQNMLIAGLLIGFAGVQIAALAYPMWKRMVPPNGLYGFRIPATCADEYVWYEANARSGKHMMVLGGIIVAVAALLPLFTRSEGMYVTTLLIVLLGGLILVVTENWLWANRLLNERRAQGNGDA